MKLIVMGSSFCKDTISALKELEEKKVDVQFLDISTDMMALRRFLKERDTNPMYDAVRAREGIGMPLFEIEGSMKTLDIEEFLKAL